MPATLTWGHVLLALGAVAGLVALGQAVTWRRYAGHGRGTPGYARARDGRRYAAWALIAGLILAAVGVAALDAPLF